MKGNTSLESAVEEKEGLSSTIFTWFKDLFEVVLTVLILIIVFRLLFNSHTLVPLVVVTSGSMTHVDGAWHAWLVENLGNESLIDSFRFQNGFTRGDMIFTVSPNKYHIIPDTRLGDVVIYERDLAHITRYGSTEPIIHRVVGVIWIANDTLVKREGARVCLDDKSIGDYITILAKCRKNKVGCPYTKYPEDNSYRLYITKGDNNPTPDQCGMNGGIALPVNEEQLKARGWIRLPYIGWVKLAFNGILQIIFWIANNLI
jgi:signal peptidase I